MTLVTKVSRTLLGRSNGGKSAAVACNGTQPGFRRIAAGLALATCLLGCGAASAATLSGNELGIYREALRAADAGKLDQATALASRGSQPIAARLIRWIALSTPGGGSFSEISAFIREYPEWPAQNALRRRAEKELSQGADPAVVLDWFGRYPPVSTDGVVTYADALIGSGKRDRAASLLRAHWVGQTPSADDEVAYVSRFGSYLRQQDHVQRLTRLLWERDEPAVRRLLPLLDSSHAALAEARLALQRSKPGADGLARAVPSGLSDDPGLAYDRLRYYRQQDNDQAALSILADPPDDLVRPALWWRERQAMVRRLLDQGDARAAYKLAANHRQDEASEASDDAEAEFLSGWIALHHLKDASTGAKHFQRLFNIVTAPISLGRGAYWLGRANDAMGDKSEARSWYEKAAKYPTTFYGQLAVHALGRNAVTMPVEPRPSAGATAAFERKELVQAARLLAQIAGRDGENTAVFIRRIYQDARTPEELALAGKLASEIGRADLAIAAAKQAAQTHTYLMNIGYPVLPMARTTRPEAEFTHAIIRQESTFNTNIVSSAGARGLMQVMPATGRLTAKNLGIKYISDAKLTSDPEYNIKLGSGYLASMVDRFGGSYAMAAAAYNAGPGRVVRWNDTYGDPRTGAISWEDWVESIPFSETRNYVMRVMEALVVYRNRMAGGNATLDLYRELSR